jgi:hypothetical protein
VESDPVKSIIIGLASGLGNAVFMLPTIKAYRQMGYRITLYVETDFPTADLWRRCVYADEAIEGPADLGDRFLTCGHWMPQSWQRKCVQRQALQFPYSESEAESNLRATGMSAPIDVSDWCSGIDRTPKYDIGIVPGSKGGTWLRKRYPGMKDIAAHYIAQGKRVAVFGLEADGVNEIPGEAIRTEKIALLPDAIAQCRVIIGTDSGVTQLASSLGVPTVVIFTGTSEIKGRPVGPHRIVAANVNCRPCQTTPRWQDCTDWKCQEIDIDAVIDAAGRF